MENSCRAGLAKYGHRLYGLWQAVAEDTNKAIAATMLINAYYRP
ncbi:hypothetical protein ACPOL_4912 [Acidisarcina polymorpha]|uniref:Uncharacterized protein n=1 Tax=Acidisarcina polymorpha TaxID=2211140 RepID=A0A2Z5G615_9BACT|nr:hypothetical protein [Acidisarcina polymorpha]AXC14174.1 hypothetical protein ACPOL_4912 [Acidisarcina polymorpha]